MRFPRFTHSVIVLLALIGAGLRTARAQDTTAPTATFTQPVPNSQIATLPGIAGTVQDEAGGSGVNSVGVALLRASDNTWWTGGAWTGSFTLLPVSLAGNVWTLAVPTPNGNNLTDGAYTSLVQVLDVAGNFRQVNDNFTVRTDTTPPVVSISEPPDKSIIHHLSAISGNVQDNKGIGRVVVGILRTVISGGTTTNLWWNGTTFTTTFATVPATLNGNTWTVNSGLPAGANLPDGVYTIIAQAFDQSGNFQQSQVNVTVDNTPPPLVAVSSPTNNSIVRSLSVVSGTAADTSTGTGVERVVLFLRRNSDGQYWNGAAWGATRIALATNFTGFNWTRAPGSPGNLPTGTDLSQGTYSVSATAFDRAGNQASSPTVTFRVDKIAPAILNFIAPSGGAIMRNLPVIRGTAVDDPAGSGIDHVSVTILRLSDFKFWTGAGWGAFTPLAAQLSNGTWTRASGLPSGANLADGSYLLNAQAFDRAGNNIQVENVIRIDTKSPTVITTVTPINGKALNSLFTIRGTAADNPGGSGVSHVDITLRRNRDLKFWNGTAWTIAATPLTTVFDGFNWSISQNLPAGADLTEGGYSLTATAFDRVDNQASATINFFIDKTAPAAVTFTAPAVGATIRSLTRVAGTTTDNAGGSGIATVTVAILRASDNRWWTGRAWGAFTELAANLSGTSWSLTTQLPAQSDLRPGVYVLIAFATDRAGNNIQASNAVTVPGPIPTPITGVTPIPVTGASTATTAAPSSVAISTASARVSTAAVQLRFSGALDADAAGDAAHYTVAVNGRAVLVESAAYSATGHTVALALAEGTLRSGDQVVVHWNGLRDSGGNSISGQAGPLAAR